MTTSTLSASDDLRHRPADGRQGRDSLFFNLLLPEHDLGLFVYTWVDHEGTAGRLVAAFGPDRRPIAFEAEHNIAMGDADFDDWRIGGLEIRHPKPLQTAEVRFTGERVRLAYDFTGTHDPFSYSRNPGGCPQWMAEDRFEQAGRVQGELAVGHRRIAFDRLAHRDHSWGRRHWGLPQHWKWIVASTPSGRALNAMLWIARGETGVNGYVLRDGQPVPLFDARAHADYDADMNQRRLTATLHDQGGAATQLELERYAILRMPFGSDTLLYEAACHATIDGEAGSGQFETQWSTAYVDRLIATEP